MEISVRNQSITELKSRNQMLTLVAVGLAATIFMMGLKLVFQSEIVIMQTPGMPNNTVIERSTFDKGAQMATLLAVTNAVSQINPANAEHQKIFLRAFLSPPAYTRIASEIDFKIEKAKSERELGSYYFVFQRYEYDHKLNRHFVIGEQHTVNAARDTAQPYVYEYTAHIENYRLWVDELTAYQSDKPHNSEWLEANKK